MMSRTEAAGRRNRRVRNPDWTPDGKGGKKWLPGGREGRSGGLISTEERLADVARAGVELRGSGNDEALRAYKRLSEVLEAHAGTVNILETLTPIGVAN